MTTSLIKEKELEVNKMIWTPTEREAYYGAVVEELEAHCSTIEERCEHLEAIVNSATSLLRLAINDFQSPYLRPMLGPLMERLNSTAAFMETALKNAPNPDK
jgi:hypothetical protein